MTKKLFLVSVLLLAAVAAVAATPDSNSQAVTNTPAIRHYLMPDHSIKSVFPDLLPQSETLTPQADNFAGGGPKRTGRPAAASRLLPVPAILLRFAPERWYTKTSR